VLACPRTGWQTYEAQSSNSGSAGAISYMILTIAPLFGNALRLLIIFLTELLTDSMELVALRTR
jgi:hypothetical protein